MAQRRRSPRVTNQCSSANSSDSDEPLEGCIKYSVQDKLVDAAFAETPSLQRLDPEEFTLVYIKKTGFTKPILLQCPPEQLDFRMPSRKSFSVADVARLVGKSTKVDVVQVHSQGGRSMTLEEFIKYYKQPKSKRKELLNLLSLEFSRTHLEDKVRAPKLIQALDWVETSWPRGLRDFNARKGCHLYPKVQHYCLLSVEGCFTDFHVDFGGTSVWYHVLKGKKIFFLVEPTAQNVRLYDEWLLSGPRQNDTFFGNIVERCERIQLEAGDTFMIPSGWIHAVYTAQDSLVFGGNFLHDYAIPMQLRIWDSENSTHVGRKFRYPQFMEMQWYAAARIVSRATGRQYVRSELVNELLKMAKDRSRVHSESLEGDGKEECTWDSAEIEQVLVDDPEDPMSKPCKMDYVYLSRLTSFEVRGFYELSEYLAALPENKRRAPSTIQAHCLDQLIEDLKSVVRETIGLDDDELATEVFGSLPAAHAALEIPESLDNSVPGKIEDSDNFVTVDGEIIVDERVASTSQGDNAIGTAPKIESEKPKDQRRKSASIEPDPDFELELKTPKRSSIKKEKDSAKSDRSNKSSKKAKEPPPSEESMVQSFTPAGEFVALGKKPLQSMLRRGPLLSAKSPYSSVTKPTTSHGVVGQNDTGPNVNVTNQVHPARSILKRPKGSAEAGMADGKMPKMDAEMGTPRPSESPQHIAINQPRFIESENAKIPDPVPHSVTATLVPPPEKGQMVPSLASGAPEVPEKNSGAKIDGGERMNSPSPLPSYAAAIAMAGIVQKSTSVEIPVAKPIATAETSVAQTVSPVPDTSKSAVTHPSTSWMGLPLSNTATVVTSPQNSQRPTVSDVTAPCTSTPTCAPTSTPASTASLPSTACTSSVQSPAILSPPQLTPHQQMHTQTPIHLQSLMQIRGDAEANGEDPLCVLDELADGLRDACLKLPNNRYARLNCTERLALLCTELDELLRMARSTLMVRAVVLTRQLDR